ncbi:MAG: FHA domain-containing protein [Chloroflexi bacterium]|nr:FHA domain-containing protein [Chloroflexota bacterium]
MDIQTHACPRCGAENTRANQLCENCGYWIEDENLATLVGTTKIHHRSGLYDQMSMPDIGLELEEGEVALQLVNSGEIFKMGYHRPITLGRNAVLRDQDSVLLDLSPYHAYSLGVSRQHARIRRVEDEYIINDLGSSNGTFLNKERLAVYQDYLLGNEASLRLGDFLIVFYYA